MLQRENYYSRNIQYTLLGAAVFLPVKDVYIKIQSIDWRN